MTEYKEYLTEEQCPSCSENTIWDLPDGLFCGTCGFGFTRLENIIGKAAKYDAWRIDKTDGVIITIRQEKWQECLEAMNKLEAVKKYCLEVLEETKDFPNWMVIVRKLMRAILKILEAEE